MELPAFTHTGVPATADQAGQSYHGHVQEDDVMNMSEYNFALNTWMTYGDLALGMTGNFGASGTLEYSTNGASTGSDHYNLAYEPGLGGAVDAIDQLSQPGQDFFRETWLPVSQTFPVGSYFNEQQDDSFSNTSFILPVANGNTTYLSGSIPDQSTNSCDIARELHFPDPALELIEPHSNTGNFHFVDTNIDHVIPDGSLQILPCSSASHSNDLPVQLPIATSDPSDSHALIPAQRKFKKKKRSTAPVSRILPCTTCWGLEKKCEGPTYCSRCTTKRIPAGLCIRVRLKDVLTFEKYLRGEYKFKVVYIPCNKSEEYTIVTLRHDRNGYPVQVKCYQFVPDLKIPHQTRTFWQGPKGYEKIETTTWSLTMDSLEVDLEPYVVKNMPAFVQRACNGAMETAVIFQQARKLIDRPIIYLGFKIHVALEMLMKGWSISGDEHLGMPTLHAEGAPCDGEIPVPAVMERQLDHMFEVLLADWEGEFCKQWESLAKNKRNSWRTELFLATFLITHVMERDALRLKIRFGSREAMNGWKHPSTPTSLIQKTIHFCNTLLAHFRALQSKDPLRIDCLEEDLWHYAGNDPISFNAMRTLQKHKSDYLDSKSLTNQKFCDRYKPGDNSSCDFTWSRGLFESTTLIRMEDYLGEGVLGWT